jgi:hypothetical protein
MKAKKWSEMDNKVSAIAHKFGISQKVKMMGSNSFKGLLYPSDLDIVSPIQDSAKVLANHFQKLFSKPLPFIFIDFKAGHSLDPDGKLRWTPKQLKAGINKGILLEDAIKDDMLVKLDFVINLNDQFVEVSEIYDTKYQSKKTKEQIEEELEQDVSDYAKENNSMKALKRFYSLLMLEDGHTRIKTELVKFFNSETGLVNKVANDLVLLQSIKKHITPDEYRNAVQSMKQRASVVEWVDADVFNKRPVPQVIKYLRRKVNPRAKEELRRLR